MVRRGDEEGLLQEGDPLRDGESLATRRLRIDEVERIKAVLREAGIACRIRSLRDPDEPEPVSFLAGIRRWVSFGPKPAEGAILASEYSVTEPAWNVIVPKADVARARAIVEDALRTDVDGTDRTEQLASGEAAPPAPVALCVVPWDRAWAVVERLGEGGIKAALGEGFGDGSIEERDYPVLVLPDDVERARSWISDLPPLETS